MREGRTERPENLRTMKVYRNIKVRMRDGVRLATTVCLPEGDGPFPVVLVRTAYNRVGIPGPAYAERGLALVVQDVRGRYDSEGEYYPFINEEADGADTLRWVRGRPWCNGKVGMFGDSYLAATQFYAALGGDEALCAINPRFMAGDCFKRAYYCDGAFSLGLTWSWLCFECSARTSEAAMMPLFDVRQVLESLPLVELDVASGGPVTPAYRDYVSNAQYGPQWEPLNVRRRFAEIRVPALLTAGWSDSYAGEALATYLALRETAATAELADRHRLLVGRGRMGSTRHRCWGSWTSGSRPSRRTISTMRWMECGAGWETCIRVPAGSAPHLRDGDQRVA